MLFEKPATSVDQQIDLLKSRGLVVNDDASARHFLTRVSFFRLTPYMRPFQCGDATDHPFNPGVELSQLVELYEFDRELRLMVMGALERVEVAVRAAISNHMGPKKGPHWYLSKDHFKQRYNHARLLTAVEKIQSDERQHYEREASRIESSRNDDDAKKASLKQKRARETYARHYALTYSEPLLMPGWAMLEEITFGNLSHLYRGLANDRDRKSIARNFNVAAPLLGSWLHTLTVVRNICAHHMRLWNREFGVKPELPRQKNVHWPKDLRAQIPHTRVALVLAILQCLMREINPDAEWSFGVVSLLEAYPNVPRQPMGLSDQWQVDRFWHSH